ncbi:MAG: pirin family protein [Pseudobdellovibrionaceae bacterium]
MIKVYPYEELGRGEFGWLDARYHFSFSRYVNRDRMGFGILRVINDDIVQPHAGFGKHPHNDMEIITFVRKGAITHEDSRGNKGVTRAGDVQVMSAGTGIFHSEHNREDTETKLFQIWIEPKVQGVQPRWETARFADRQVSDALPLLVSGRDADQGKGALYIHADASISGGKMGKGVRVTHPIHDQAYILVSQGEIEVEGRTLREGDGMEVTQVKEVTLEALSDAEVIVIDVPQHPEVMH